MSDAKDMLMRDQDGKGSLFGAWQNSRDVQRSEDRQAELLTDDAWYGLLAGAGSP